MVKEKTRKRAAAPARDQRQSADPVALFLGKVTFAYKRILYAVDRIEQYHHEETPDEDTPEPGDKIERLLRRQRAESVDRMARQLADPDRDKVVSRAYHDALVLCEPILVNDVYETYQHIAERALAWKTDAEANAKFLKAVRKLTDANKKRLADIATAAKAFSGEQKTGPGHPDGPTETTKEIWKTEDELAKEVGKKPTAKAVAMKYNNGRRVDDRIQEAQVANARRAKRMYSI